MDFKQIDSQLKPFYGSILSDICPGGKLSGSEYKAGEITGGPGDSFSFNINTGKWADFAKNEKGSDVISLYSRVCGINNAEAAKALQKTYLGREIKHTYPVKQEITRNIIKPPENHAPPEATYQSSKYSQRYDYRDQNGEPLFYVYRFDMPDGTKQFFPYTFNDSGQWQKKAWPAPRPLFNLDKIFSSDNPILIVEGEKTALAAAEMLPMYTVTTWSSGATAFDKTDFSPVYGRKILLWPDGDEVGIKAMSTIAGKLREHCPSVKIINPDRNSGWDAADAYAEGMTADEFKKWARPLVTEFHQEPQIRDVQENKSKSVVYIELGLTPISQKNPLPVCNISNAIKLLNYIPKYAGRIWFDTFHLGIMTNYDGETRKWKDSDDINITVELQRDWDMHLLSKTTVQAAVELIATNNTRNELKEWLESLKWDGVERVNDFLINAYGVEKNEYTAAISRNWLIGVVARGIKPGCKFDEMLILEGYQGSGKSTSIEALVGKFMAKVGSDFASKDFMQEIAGAWIVEIEELDQFKKADANLIKKKLSQRVDRYRPSYGRQVIDVPRTCVFVGTTNQDEYLKDETGGRRFWPIKVSKADLDYILANREQLFAEAVALFKQGHSWHKVPESAKQEQEARREHNTWEEVIAEYLHKNNGQIIVSGGQPPFEPIVEPLTVKNIARYIINIEYSRMTKLETVAVGKCMRALGYNVKPVKRFGMVTKEYHKDA